MELTVTSTPPARMILRSATTKKRDQLASVEKESAKSKKNIVDVTLNRKDSGSSSESANDAPEPAQEEGENKSENPTSKSSEQSDQNSLPAVQTHPTRSRDSRRHTRK